MFKEKKNDMRKNILYLKQESYFLAVIDCGYVKTKWFDAETCTDRLITVPISKSSADQRAGRAGRMKSGKVYR